MNVSKAALFYFIVSRAAHLFVCANRREAGGPSVHAGVQRRRQRLRGLGGEGTASRRAHLVFLFHFS